MILKEVLLWNHYNLSSSEIKIGTITLYLWIYLVSNPFSVEIGKKPIIDYHTCIIWK